MPNLVQLLGSKNPGDVTETIKLLISLKVYKFPTADVIHFSISTPNPKLDWY